MKKNTVLYALLVFMSLILYIYTNNQVSFFLLVFLIALFIISIAYSYYIKKNIEFIVKISDSAKANEEMPIQFLLTKKTKLPMNKLELNIKYYNVLFGITYDEKHAIDLSLNQREIIIQQMNHYCGKVDLVLYQARVYDLFGLFSFQIEYNNENHFIVYPHYYQFLIELNQELYKNEMGDFYLQNRKGNDNGEIFDLREYQRGDSLKKVHWKVSSKYEELIIKEYAHPSSFHTMLLYDGVLNEEYDTMNTLFGALISTSDAFIKKGISHYVGYFDKELKRIAVEGINEFDSMIDSVLSSTVIEKTSLNVESFISMNYGKEVSSVIYFTNRIDELALSLLSDYTTVTVVLLAHETIMHNHPNYHIISLDIDSLEKQVTSLFI